MKKRATSLVALLSLLTSCEPPKPTKAAEVNALQFPVVVLHPNSRPVLHVNAEDLGTMHSNHLLAEGPHELIDSSFAFYTLERLRSTKSGLSLMISPVGATPVTFELKRSAISGAAAAREALGKCIPSSLDEAEATARRRAMEKAETLSDMLAAFQGSEP